MKKGFLYLLVLITAISSCKKSEELSPVPITDLYPLQAGKVFYYRLDSTIPSNDRLQLLKKSYNAKDSVDIEYLDNAGRKSFRIFRYLRDTLTPIANNSNWKYAATYYTSFDANRVEYIDNNLRFVTLTNPVREGSKWNGTQYINTSGGGSSSNPLGFYDNWTFEYQNTGQDYQVKKGTIPDSYTVLHIDETDPSGPLNPASFQIRNLSYEVYAKGIGLIYKDFLHYNYQSPNGYDVAESFGIRLSLIDYK